MSASTLTLMLGHRQPTIEKITPEKARIFMKRNTNNRPASAITAKRYAEFMTRGLWVYTGDPIKFSDEGVMLDGQTRCAAVIRSGVTIECAVQRDLPADVFSLLDSGRKRSAGHALHVAGFPNSDSLAAAARIYYGLCFGYPGSLIGKTGKGLSNSQVIEVASAVSSLGQAVTLVNNKGFTMRRGPKAVYSALAAATFEADAHKAQAFWDSVIFGLGLSRGDPALALRKKMEEELKENGENPNKSTRNAQHWQWCGWAIAAWNAFYKNQTRAKVTISVKKDENGVSRPHLSSIAGWASPTVLGSLVGAKGELILG